MRNYWLLKKQLLIFAKNHFALLKHNLVNLAVALVLAGCGAGSESVVTDDPLPTMTVTGVSVTEGDNAVITVTISQSWKDSVTFSWATATLGADTTLFSQETTDFTSGSGTVTIAPGSTSATITVATVDDALPEGTETFVVALSNPSNATLSSSTATVTVSDNEVMPQLSIDDVVIAEGGVAVYTVTADAISGQNISFDWTVSNATTTNADFLALSGGGITIPAGSTTVTFNVPTADDSISEATETFSIVLANATYATFLDNVGGGTITDNDAAPNLSISDVTVIEGSTVNFTVTLSAASQQAVTFDWASANGSASAPGDYIASGAAGVVIAAGSTSVVVSVPTVQDTLNESDESFTVTLSNPSNSAISDGTGVATITDNDSLPTISINSVSAPESGTATFTVTLSSTSALPINVDYTTSSQTAVSGTDFTAASGTLTIPAGSTTVTFDVTLTDDTLDEDTETFNAVLSNPINGTIAVATGTGTITDNDALPSLSIDNVALAEGGVATFTVTLDAASGKAVSFDWASSNGTALSGSDYTAASGTTITIPAGSTTTTVTVITIDDVIDENSESFNVTISNPSNATIGTSTGVATLSDNDATPTLSINDLAVTEGGTALLTVTLSAASGLAVTVDWTTASNTSVSPGDFTSASGTATIAAGSTTSIISVTTIDDIIDENSESFNVNLSNPSNSSISDSQGVVTVNDNDAQPSLTIDDVSVTEGGNLSFTVTLNTASGLPVAFDWTTSNGTATTPADYTASSGSGVTIAAGSLTATLVVPTVDDAIDESSEAITVTISNAQDSVIGDANGTGTINDNDALPQISIDDVTVTEGGTATFTATINAVSGLAVTFDWATSNNTALSASDYTASSGTAVTIPAGSTSVTFNVPTTNNAVHEATETYNVTISNPGNSTIADATGVGTINDNDAAPTLAIDDVSVTEGGTLAFTVTLTGATDRDTNFDWSTSNGTSVAGSDYNSASGTGTILAGSTTASVNVVTIQDAIDENNETLTVTLANPVNSTIAVAAGTGTINDNDALPVISVNNTAVAEGGTATFTVSLDTASGLPVTFDWASSNDTAVSGSDYTANSAAGVTIPAGTTSVTFNVVTLADGLSEPVETFNVTLSNLGNATAGDLAGVGSISDLNALPTLSVDDVVVTEGGVATFTATLSAVSAFNVTFDWSSSNGTALAGSDFNSNSGTGLTITAGSLTQTFTVSTTDDAIDENSEAFTVTVGNPTNATIAVGTGTGTINDNDATPTLSVNDVTIGEGGTATFTVTLSAVSGLNTSFDWATSNNTALSGSDYTAASGAALGIPAGSTFVTFDVVTLDDVIDENDEGFNVVISNPINSSLGDATGAGTITDNDALPTLSINDVTVTEGTNASFTVTLNAVSGRAVTFDWATSNGTAVQPGDYTTNSGTGVTIAAGSTTATVVVTTIDDSFDEDTEAMTVTISNPTFATISDATGSGTLNDNDATPTLSINDISITENSLATFTVTLSAPSNKPVTFDWATSNGTANAGADYTAASGTALTIAAGATTAQINVTLSDDALDEADETFAVTITNPSNSTIATAVGTATITDNDALPDLSINNASSDEGDIATFTVSLSVVSGRAVTFDWATANGTALAPGDYDSDSATAVVIPAGSTSVTIDVETNEDSLNESAEAYTIGLSNAVNANITGATGTGTINDDDAIPSLSINNASVAEAGVATFTVTMNAIAGQDVDVDYATSFGTATGGDFTTVSGTVTIPTGSTSITFDITTTADTLDEIDETYTVTLSNPINATISSAVGTGTITDDDVPPTLSINSISVSEAAGTASFTVSLSAVSGKAISFDWASSNDTALSPGDYTADSSTGVLIAAGSPSTTVVLTLIDDALNESSETFEVDISNPTNATLATSNGVATITDNDSIPTLSINDITLTEGGTATLTVTLSAAAGQNITFDYATSNNTAIAGSDFTSTSGSKTINAGSTTVTIDVVTLDDAADEADQTFNVVLSNPANATITDNTGVVTISDNDPLPSLSVNDVTITEGATATFTVTLTPVSGKDVDFTWSTSDDTAVAPTDYAVSSGSLTIPAGSTSVTFNVVSADGTVFESAETFNVTLAGEVNATLGDAGGVATINDNDSAPTLSVDDVSIAEGGLLTFTVTQSAVSALVTNFNWASSNGTALAPGDYTSGSGTGLSIAAGSTTQTFTVTTVNDALNENDETVNVTISAPINSTIADATGVGTVQDNDAPPTLSIDDVTLTEGGTATFTVTLSAVSGLDADFDYATSNGTAVSGSDYDVTSGSTTIPAGSTTITIDVDTTDDALDEGDETFNVALTNPVDSTVLDGTGVGTLNDNDPLPTIAVSDVTVAEGGTATFTVTLTPVSGKAVDFTWSTSDGTALQPADYANSSGSVTIPAGTTTATFDVVTANDAIHEVTQTFTVTLAGEVNATISDATGVGTITDNDALPTLSVNDVSIAEGGNLTFTVTQSAVSSLATTFDWASSNGTGVAPGDYTSASGTALTIAAGATTQTFTVVTVNDALYENDETVTVTLSNPANATIADATGTGTIQNNDAVPSLTIDDISITEGGTATFTVTLSAVSGLDADFDYATANVTAISGSDYDVTTGSTTIPAGSTTITIDVDTTDDGADEADETYNLVLSNPVNSTIADTTGVGTLTDNDPLPSLSVNDVTITEGGTATFTVTLTPASGKHVDLTWSTSNGTAVNPTDYATSSGNLNIPAGTTSITFDVVSANDAIYEVQETFSVTLAGEVNATISDAVGVATINDNDTPPSLSVDDVAVAEGGVLTFTVTQSATSGLITTFNWATSNSTAVAPGDYVTASGTALVIAAGDTTETFTVTTNDDGIYELNEAVTVTISAAINATIADATGAGTITDNDTAPTIAINDISIGENSSAVFTVSLTGDTEVAASVNYSTANGTATAPADYTTASGTVNFPVGTSNETITVTLINDTTHEPSEAFTVSLAGAVQSTISDASGTATVTDNDVAPTLTINDISVTEGGVATFTVTLSEVSAYPVTFDWATLANTALAPSDFTSGSAAGATIAAGSLTTTINVTTIDDAVDEDAQDFFVVLSNPTNATFADDTGLGTINDNDASPTLSINDVSAAEGGVVTFTVTASAASQRAIQVDYASVNGTATVADSDYTADSGTLTIPVGNTTEIVTITTLDNVIYEGDETFSILLTSPVAATISDATGIGTITENDLAPALSINDIAVNETDGTATFTVTLTGATAIAATFDWATSDGTAAQPNDYQTATASGSIPFGDTTTTVVVTLLNDARDENAETFNVTLSNPTHATLSDATGVATITDDDAAPSISINNVTVTEGAVAGFTVSVSTISEKTILFDWTTVDDSSFAPGDYTFASAVSASIPPNTASVTVNVTTIDDAIDEPSETYDVVLSNPSNATLGTDTGIGTILDNDTPPELSINDITITEGSDAVFTISIDATSEIDVQVDWSAVNGTASQPTDFTAASGTATILAGNLSTTVTVNTVNGTVYEHQEAFTVQLANPSNASINDGSGTATINDNDAMPTLAIDDVSVTEGAVTTFTVTVTGDTDVDLTFDWTTSNGTAVDPSDYTADSATGVTILAGNTSTTINVTTIDDALNESSENYSIILSNPVDASIADNTGIGTINDNDSTTTLSVADVTVAEGVASIAVTVSLNTASGQNVYFDYATSDGTATDPLDYTAVSGAAQMIAAGATTTTFNIPIINDVVICEGPETITVTLSNPVNATLADPTAVVTITDNDPSMSINSPTVAEGALLTFTVTISAICGSDVTFSYTSANGTAAAGTDYTTTAGSGTITAGLTTTTIDVPTTDDALAELSETLTMTLSLPTNAAITTAAGTGTLTDNDPVPDISVADTTVTEGSNVGFVISLNTIAGSAITVNYTTTSGTAIVGPDFTNAAAVATIAAGTLSTTINVVSINDTLDEDAETFTFGINSPNLGTIIDATATGTLNDNDVAPQLSIDDINQTEGTAFVFTVSLDTASGKDVTFDWASSNGTALAGSDYTANSGTAVIIPAGSTSTTVTVNTTDDAASEVTEDFNVTISNPSNASIADATGIGTVDDNETGPDITINNVTVTEGSAATFTVTLSTAVGSNLTVDWSTSDDSAVDGNDYTGASGTVTVLAGNTTATFNVNTTNDTIDEDATETFNVTLTNESFGSITDDTGVGTINDNDAAPTLSVSDPSVNEGGNLTFVISLSHASSNPITFDWATSDGTATTADSDYSSASGNDVTINAGSTSINRTVNTTGDTKFEANETITVTISDPTNATIADATGTGTINNNDAAPTLSIDDVIITEGGTAVFTVTLSQVSTVDATFDWATSNNTATAGSDYTAGSGTTVTIPAGSTSTTFNVVTTDDAVVEASETYNVTISNPTGSTIADNIGIGTITDNETAPTLSINDIVVAEGVLVSFTVTLSAASAQNVTFDWTTNDGTALAGSDYTANSGTGTTITAGNTTATINVTSIDDALAEASENFTVVISNPTNATITDNTGIATLTDNDATPTISIADTSVAEGGTLIYTVSLSTAAGVDVTFDWTTSNGTATTADSDYTTTSGTAVTIAAGATSTTINVNTTHDTKNEADETVTVTLSNATNATNGDLVATGTITNNDGVPTLSIDDIIVSEADGTATFTVTLSAASALDVDFDFATADTTATAGSDYTASSGTRSILAGSTTETIVITIADDNVFDGSAETYQITLSNPVNATIADATGVGTINDNDALKLNDTVVAGGNISSFKVSPDGATVVFLADLDTAGKIELYSVNVDGSNHSKLNGAITAGGNVVSFEISPDSSYVVFLVDQTTDEKFELYSSDISGGGATKLNDAMSAGGDVTSYAISANSSKVVYLADQDVDNDFELYSINIGGTSRTQLNAALDVGGDVTDFAISANSSKVVYIADQDTNDIFELYSVNMDATSNTLISDSGMHADGDVSDFAISANSSLVVFTADATVDNDIEIHSVSISGGAISVINGALTAGGDVSDFKISANSSKVVYVADQDTDGTLELYSANTDGSSQTKISGAMVGGGNIESFLISANSSKVVYRADKTTDAVLEVYSVNIGGGGEANLTGGMAAGRLTLSYEIDSTSARVIYIADKDVATDFEIFSVAIGGGASTQLNGALPVGGDVDAFSITGSNVVYVAEETTNGVKEVYTSAMTGGGSTKQSNDMPAGGDATTDPKISGSNVIFRADMHVNDTVELFVVPL